MNMFGTALCVSLSIPIAYIWGLQGIPANWFWGRRSGRSLPGRIYAGSRSRRSRFLLVKSQLKRQAF